MILYIQGLSREIGLCLCEGEKEVIIYEDSRMCVRLCV